MSGSGLDVGTSSRLKTDTLLFSCSYPDLMFTELLSGITFKG